MGAWRSRLLAFTSAVRLWWWTPREGERARRQGHPCFAAIKQPRRHRQRQPLQNDGPVGESVSPYRGPEDVTVVDTSDRWAASTGNSAMVGKSQGCSSWPDYCSNLASAFPIPSFPFHLPKIV